MLELIEISVRDSLSPQRGEGWGENVPKRPHTDLFAPSLVGYFIGFGACLDWA
jgi:hypothetical protein